MFYQSMFYLVLRDMIVGTNTAAGVTIAEIILTEATRNHKRAEVDVIIIMAITTINSILPSLILFKIQTSK